MKRILSLLTVIIALVSCSESETTNEELNLNEFPTNISLSTENISIGDVLTINADGFSQDESYVVSFENNIIGQITETNSDSIKVIVPENTESGNVYLTVNNQTEVIGNIFITSKRLFLFNRHNSDEELMFVEYDLSTLSQTTIINLSTLENFEKFTFNGSMASAYHESRNEIIAIIDYKELLRLKLSDNTFTSTVLTNEDYETYKGLTITPDGSVYMFKRNNSINTGEKIDLISYDLDSSTETTVVNGSEYYEDFNYFSDVSTIFDNVNNEIITLIDRTTLLRVNLTENSMSTIELTTDDQTTFKGLTMTSSGEVYMIKRNYSSPEQRSLIKFNLSSLTETHIMSLDSTNHEETYSSFGDINTVYNSDTNEIIALMSYNTLMKINLSDNTVFENILSDVEYDFYKGLIIK